MPTWVRGTRQRGLNLGGGQSKLRNPICSRNPQLHKKNPKTRREGGQRQSKGWVRAGVELTVLLLLGPHSRAVQLLPSETQQTHSSYGMGYPGPGSTASFLPSSQYPPRFLSPLGWAWPCVDGAVLVLTSARPSRPTPALVQFGAFPNH